MANRNIEKKEEKTKPGKKILNFLLTETNRRKLSQHLKDRARTKMIRQVSHDRESHLEDILRVCLKHISPITAPLVLISQISDSGGVLLSRLLDGHSEIHAYPCAFAFENPEKHLWPKIDLRDKPEHWLEIIFEKIDIENIQEDFKQDEKGGHRIPHIFLPVLQERIFLKYLASLATIKTRDVFDAWMTACFGAWLNYQNHGDGKKYITAFTPELANLKENMESFFEIYPDGRLIYLVGNPHSWYISALQAEPEKYADVNWSVMRWKERLRSVLWTKERFTDHACLIKVEDLVNKPESVMRHLAEFLGLQYDPTLLIPTFNGDPISVDGSFKMAAVDVIKGQSKDYPTLGNDQSKIIAEMTKDDYQEFLNETVRF